MMKTSLLFAAVLLLLTACDPHKGMTPEEIGAAAATCRKYGLKPEAYIDALSMEVHHINCLPDDGKKNEQ